jgi:tRNA U34 5-methylaminomethyl-2-thiouridine-forming methyltransferase MnmC
MNNFQPQLTADGSYTFFSPEFEEAFHSIAGAKQEAEEKFIKPSQIAQKAQTSNTFNLLDICYGLGYNTAAALETIWTVNPQCQVNLIALELDQNVPVQALTNQLLNLWLSPIPHYLAILAHHLQVHTPQLQAQLKLGDARVTLKQVYQEGFQADAIFLDPFSPPKCPQLWTVEFIGLLAQCLAPTGRIATYSSAASVRTALGLAGLHIGSTRGVGRKSPGTIASFASLEDYPLSPQENEHFHTRAAIPYRDPRLQESAVIISKKRQEEQEKSLLEPTSHWKKRWQS